MDKGDIETLKVARGALFFSPKVPQRHRRVCDGGGSMQLLHFSTHRPKKNAHTSVATSGGSWQNMHLRLNAKCTWVPADILQTPFSRQQKYNEFLKRVKMTMNSCQWAPRRELSSVHKLRVTPTPRRRFADAQIAVNIVHCAKLPFKRWTTTTKN